MLVITIERLDRERRWAKWSGADESGQSGRVDAARRASPDACRNPGDALQIRS